MLRPSAISKLVPLKIKGYTIKGDSRATTLAIGTLHYSLCERVFSKHNKTVKVLLFDYAEAPIMFSQSLKKWKEADNVANDSVTFTNVKIKNGDLWESAHPRSKRAQIIAGLNDRFFLTIEAENMTSDELREFFGNFDLRKFPE